MYIRRDEIEKYNPWKTLPQTPDFVLRQDAPRVLAYNGDPKRAAADRIRLEIPPCPYVGSPYTAQMVILTKAPSWDEESIEEYQQNPEYARQARRNLTFGNEDYPFYYLNPEFSQTRGYQWWYPKLRELIEACDARTDGQGQRCVARGLMTIAFFPYHANDYVVSDRPMASQGYSIGLVRMLAEEGIPIIITSARADWTRELRVLRERAVPGRSTQNSSVSRTSLPAGVFDQLVERLTSALVSPGAPVSVAPETVMAGA